MYNFGKTQYMFESHPSTVNRAALMKKNDDRLYIKLKSFQ